MNQVLGPVVRKLDSAIHRLAGLAKNKFIPYKSRVTVLRVTSTTLLVTSAVPQGSTLVPILFTLYVNDLPEAVKFGQIAMFADDTKLFSTVKTENGCKNLQNDLDSLQVWSSVSGLSFNDKKCKAQHITRKIAPNITTYKLSINLEQIDS